MRRCALARERAEAGLAYRVGETEARLAAILAAQRRELLVGRR